MHSAFICGPEPMMRGIARALEDHGMDKARIRYELFTSDQPGKLKQAAKPTGTQSGTSHDITVTLDGATRTLRATPGATVLETALANDMDAPFACRAGVCSTCRCKVIEGEAEMAANHALEDYEVAQGYVLSCQARPVSDRLIVSYDM